MASNEYPTDPRRRGVVGSLAGGALLAAVPHGLARAQAFPSRPITLVVPFPPGGATDIQFRALATAVSKELGQSVVIANRPGAAGTLGPSQMAQTAAPDGYTLAVLPGTMFRLPHLQKVNWDPLRDFTYVIALTSYTFAVVVAADAPWKTLAELLADAKANPDRISYGTVGKGSTGHIGMARLLNAAGVKMNFVPFKGAAEELTALIGGHINVVSDAGWGAQAQAGKIRLLATMTPERVKGWPAVPTLRDLGYDITALSMLGIGGPRGMDPALVKQLHDAFRKASRDPAWLSVLQTENQPEIYMNSEDYRRYAGEQFENDRRFVRELGLSLE